MRRKRFHTDTFRGRGRRMHGRGMRRGFQGRRGFYADAWEDSPRSWRTGRRRGVGPWQEVDDFGPPPWAPHWGWRGDPSDVEETNASFGPPPWSMGRWMREEDEDGGRDRRSWLEARKDRLMAWKEHLDERLAATEAELAAWDASTKSQATDEEIG